MECRLVLHGEHPTVNSPPAPFTFECGCTLEREGNDLAHAGLLCVGHPCDVRASGQDLNQLYHACLELWKQTGSLGPWKIQAGRAREEKSFADHGNQSWSDEAEEVGNFLDTEAGFGDDAEPEE